MRKIHVKISTVVLDFVLWYCRFNVTLSRPLRHCTVVDDSYVRCRFTVNRSSNVDTRLTVQSPSLHPPSSSHSTVQYSITENLHHLRLELKLIENKAL